VVTLIVIVLLAGLWVTARRGAGASPGGGAPAARGTTGLETVEVGRHDTLWGIASRGRPEVDPRVTIRRIIELNGLSGAIIRPGQRLRMPPR
jgi:hypothetical protein